MSVRLIRRVVLGVGVLMAAVGLMACSGGDDGESEETPTATSTQATESPTETPSGDAPHEVDSAACGEIAPVVQAAFPGVALIEDSTAFEAGGGTLIGEGCRVMVRGSAAELRTFSEVASTLHEVLESQGWVEDPQYAADGPTGTMSVFTDGAGGIAVLAAGVSPNDPTACPADQIIGECLDGLDPEEVTVQGEVVIGAMP